METEIVHVDRLNEFPRRDSDAITRFSMNFVVHCGCTTASIKDRLSLSVQSSHFFDFASWRIRDSVNGIWSVITNHAAKVTVLCRGGMNIFDVSTQLRAELPL